MFPWWTYPAGGCFLLGTAAGWFIGYAHRDFIELGRRCGRLLAKHRCNPLGWLFRAYREVWRDIADHWAKLPEILAGPPHQERHHPQVPARTLPLFLGEVGPPVQPVGQQRRQRGPRDIQEGSTA